MVTYSGPRYNFGARSGFDSARHGGVVVRAYAGYPVLPTAVLACIAGVCLGKATPLGFFAKLMWCSIAGRCVAHGLPTRTSYSTPGHLM